VPKASCEGLTSQEQTSTKGWWIKGPTLVDEALGSFVVVTAKSENIVRIGRR
jgi:hypothetical protein